MKLKDILEELRNLEQHVIKTASTYSEWLSHVNPRYVASAQNLLHYIALRQWDLRKLQIALGSYGMTLSQCERHILRNLKEVIARTESSLGKPSLADPSDSISWDEAKHLLHEHTRAVFGVPISMAPATEPHQAIMVTADGSLDYILSKKLLAAGASILRINSAHDCTKSWREFSEFWRQASDELGKKNRVMLDIAGPKLRTGRVTMPTPVLKFRPVRAYDGTVRSSFKVVLKSGSKCSVSQEVWCFPDLDSSDQFKSLRLIDSRGSKRTFPIVRDDAGDIQVEGNKTCYMNVGCKIVLEIEGGEDRFYTVDSLEAADKEIVLSIGDTFKIVSPEHYENCEKSLPIVECLEASIVSGLQLGQSISFDDGHIVSKVIYIGLGEALLVVESAIKPFVKLRREKGINFPDAMPNIPLLSPVDVSAIEFGLKHVDIISFSFIRGPDDVENILNVLKELDAPPDIPIVLKIETSESFAQLPAILLTAMKHYPVSVMIARGDLAVEVGYMRSGEVQEQILGIAEAAHLPVVLATEVFGRLLKTGSPSRAEVTDAAMSVRAECVMLNKGTFILEATKSLRDMLLRMQMHRYKNLEIFRPTSWSHSLDKSIPG